MFADNIAREIEMMLKMPQQQNIRFLREVEGCSVNEIAESVGIHWRTAKKYAIKRIGTHC